MVHLAGEPIGSWSIPDMVELFLLLMGYLGGERREVGFLSRLVVSLVPYVGCLGCMLVAVRNVPGLIGLSAWLVGHLVGGSKYPVAMSGIMGLLVWLLACLHGEPR